MDNNKEKVETCILSIVEWFSSDACILLDCVLTDDSIEPEYSANTVYNRLEKIVLFEHLYHDNAITNVYEWLKLKGYSQGDIELFKHRILDEQRRYNCIT